MAAAVERLAGGDIAETKAHFLIRALETAQDHGIGDVRAFAQGCDDNDYAQAMQPMLTLFARRKDKALIRKALHDIFETGVETAWENWPYNNVKERAEERAGLNKFLQCRSNARAKDKRLAAV